MVVSLVAPRLMVMGGGAVAKLGEVLGQLGLSRPLVVTDPFMLSSGLLERALEPLRQAGMVPAVFSETVPDPTDTVIAAGVAVLAAGEYDCLVGFGGGSPMDTAKAMAILAAAPAGARMRDFKVPAAANRGAVPIICVPTTAGTGSEATRFTVITDTETDEKMLIAGLGALPLAAVVDHELTFGLPARITADTGIDSLTHALEAFVSARANPVSDDYARSAMRLIAPNLRRVWADPQDAAAREAMMRGATLAGLAFSNASVALVHGMSRPIGAHFHVPHGLSNAMLLPAVTAFGLEAARPRYAEAARVMGIASEAEGDQAAAQRLVEELRALNRDLAVPSPARWGIDAAKWEGLLPLMAKQALASGSPANNPRVPDEAEIVALYQASYGASA
ncbi:iron-containing alcohol dehydrogenase [Falsiroseomonas selenitidurans]|uniref:Iron-containing alcohol dehydrogenase n=1 Tax=Falsiroseomonas selenitidurans TaxID=2716335 RepID=A0ABX1E6A5_9PROT|nr:iron-containing alcohol dehydrogenase [Falsiroseomonas selenitidurans]NKC31302.1 iron-containing alcohol dehydrogenase [Falsiroseomonas selenitidurans]